MELDWSKLAKEELDWSQDFDQILDDRNPPFYQWFLNGKLNISENCLERNIKAGLGKKTAIIFEGEAGDKQTLNYEELLIEVSKLANALMELGLVKGDRVGIYMPLCPQAIIAMQACARLGLIHSVVFAGFSSTALQDRLKDCEAKLLITADLLLRKGKSIKLLEIAHQAIQGLETLEHMICFSRLSALEAEISIPATYAIEEAKEQIQNLKLQLKNNPRLAFWDWTELCSRQATYATALALDANDTSFILYTSGSTGKAKAIEHRVAGYLLWVKITMRLVFDIKPEDVYWCSADIGWITGHSYVAYGPLAVGATQVIYEGAPNYPDKDRFWNIIDKYSVSIFYTAPTAIRSFIEWGDAYVLKHKLSSLRLLGSVGEPISPEVWQWYHDIIGKGRCPIVDTWWQTETGGIMISTLPGQPMKAAWAGKALPGISVTINEEGLLLITKPWPSMLKGIFRQPQLYIDNYWKRVPNCYTAGDAAHQDSDGYIRLDGRIDDVINVSGHRLGTAEIESALLSSDAVAEAAVVSIPHHIKGESIIAFVNCSGTISQGSKQQLSQELIELVSSHIGAFARPEKLVLVSALPKTRSGKIMRRLLKDIAQSKEIHGDLSTLEDPSVITLLEREFALA